MSISVSDRGFAETSSWQANENLHSQYASLGCSGIEQINWSQYESLIESIVSSSSQWPAHSQFEYHHPAELQDATFGLGKSYSVPLAYSDPGGTGEPVIAIGGLTNTSQRFDFLALDTMPKVRLIGLDLAGRGYSGWMTEISDYTLNSYIEQLRQFLDHMSFDACTLLGSSLGGTIAICFCARYPHRVKRIILNDSGPFIPRKRRTRRAVAVARFYVFKSPCQMFRRTGAAAKHTGPVADAVLLHNSHHKTCWSQTENGRVYRHDLRAMLAYRSEADNDLNVWSDWNHVTCPVLLLHGTESDATTTQTIEQMRNGKQMSVIHIQDTGHTPQFGGGRLNGLIRDWVLNDHKYSEDLHLEPLRFHSNILYPND